MNTNNKRLTVLVTHATQYAGPGAVGALCAAGHSVVCHDPGFGDKKNLEAWQTAHPDAVCLQSRDARSLVAELGATVGPLDAMVSNDVFPITVAPVEEVLLDDLRRTFEAVFVFPFELTQLLLPDMKRRRNGCLVYVTSARPLRPEPGFSVPTSVRAGTTAFAQALAREVAGFDIQVNAIAPNYLHSEMYYPRAQFMDNEAGRQKISSIVPAGRLGTQEEVGAAIAFLVSGQCRFMTGQVLYFTGGWP